MSKEKENHTADAVQDAIRTAAPVFENDESLLALVLSNSEDIILLVDKDLNIQLFNDMADRKFRQYFGRSLAKGDYILDYAEPAQYEEMKKLYAEVFSGKNCERTLDVIENGTKKYLRNSYRPARDKSGAIIATIISTHDITQETTIRQALIESEERLRFALEGSNHGIWDWNIQNGDVFFSASWKRMLGFDESVVIKSIADWEVRIHPEDILRLRGDIEEHLISQQPYYETIYRLRDAVENYRWILGRGKIVETAEDGTPLRMIGTHTDITEKIETEKQYRELFEINPLPTYIYDYDSLHILAVNKAAVEHYGYTKEEFLKLTIFELQPPEQLPLMEEKLRNRDKEPNSSIRNWRHKTKDGRIFIVEIKGITIVYNGRKARLMVINDVTKRVVAEEALKFSYERFEYASKATSDAIYDWDIQADQLKWSEGITTLFGYNPAEISITCWEKLIHPDEQKSVSNSLNATLYKTREKLWIMEYRFLKADKTYSYVIEKGFILRDTEGRPLRMIGAMQDISSLKEQQLQLAESNQRYEYATLAISDIIWDWILESGCVLWSDNYEKVTGWKLPVNKCVDLETCVARFHESDRDRVYNSMNDALLKKEQTLWEAELKYIKSNGEIAHIYNRAYILRDEAGTAVRMIGAMQEITERKKLEEQLLQKELDKKKVISKATIDTQERERSEIGKELHDNVNQILTTTKLYLDLAIGNAGMKDDLLLKSQKNILYVINEIRQLSRSLMNPSLGDLGFIDSINDLIENIRATRRLHVEFETSENIEALLPDNLELTMYRIIQEALNNAVRHAHATTVTISLQKKANQLELLIQDDGIGFNPEGTKKGAGLKSIQNRVYLADGTLLIKSSPGAGCTLAIHFTL